MTDKNKMSGTMKAPIIMQHHGKCDMCTEKHVKVTHFNYHEQENGFRLCEPCRKLRRYRMQTCIIEKPYKDESVE